MTDSLLSNSSSKECTNTREQLLLVASQLKSLLKICNTYMSHIEDVINLDRESLLNLVSQHLLSGRTQILNALINTSVLRTCNLK